MPHHTPLIATIVGGIVLAFLFGTLAHRLKMPPLIGYLIAGIVMGPFTPGFVGDLDLAHELSEIGVILLMFGVGLHFSLKDLISVKNIALPGAIVQLAIATFLGIGLGWLLGWPWGEGLLYGLALSTASTVVLLTAMQERRLVETDRGRIAIGWLIVEDIAMVLVLVLIPALSGVLKGDNDALTAGELLGIIAITIGKVVAFVAVMLIVGRRVIPWILERIANTGSRELFSLSVLAIALGFAMGAAYIFGVSFALGAFFAGMILAESELSHRAAEESLPLRDAFAVLFFVSVGMLFNPSTIIKEPLLVIITLLIIMLGKSLGAYVIVRLFRYSRLTALTISASLAQIGEFAFIIASMGLSLGILSPTANDLILAGAILSILLNPVMFLAVGKIAAKLEAISEHKKETKEVNEVIETPAPQYLELQQHAVLVGYGRVGKCIADGLKERQIPFVVLENRKELVDKLREEGDNALWGNAVGHDIFVEANIATASYLFVAIPGIFESGQLINRARELNPYIEVIVHSHTEAESEYLEKYGVNHIVMGEKEIASGMLLCIQSAKPA